VTARPPPRVRLADRKRIFRQRAERFAHLAKGHPVGGFLSFMAELATAQQSAIDALSPLALPGEKQLLLCYEHGLPPLGRQGWRREAAWRHALRQIIAAIPAVGLPAGARAAMERLGGAGDEALERWADAVLRGDLPMAESALSPFLAAALEVYWVRMATALDAGSLSQGEHGGSCPVCGSAPVAGTMRIGGELQGLRYLSCALCGTEWHMVRIKCSQCQSTKGIAYYKVEGGPGASWGAVKAETCEACRTYLKLLYMEKDADVDAVADDLATLSLDVLLAEQGWHRAAPNPFLLAEGSE
jgi:FdhE protein